MRYADWTSRLGAAIETAKDRPFSRGGHDCCIAVCDLALAVAPIEDPGLPWRGRYKTHAGARRVLAGYLRHTGSPRPGLPDLLPLAVMKRAAEMGLARVPVLRAQRADIVLAETDTANGVEPVLAMVDLTGRGLLAASDDRGWRTLPIATGQMAWRL